MAEKITVQSVSDIITSKAGNQYFTLEDMEQKRYVCYNPNLKEHCKVSSEIEADLTPGKTPDDSPRLDMIYVNGKPVISVEKKTAGRSYGKSDKELLQIRQLAEAQNRSIQAQTALNRAVDLAVAGKLTVLGDLSPDIKVPEVDENVVYLESIKILAGEFYQLLQSLTQISEAQVIHKEVKDISDKVSTKETRQGSGEFDEVWWLKSIKILGKEWIAEQLKLLGVTVQKGQLLIKTIKALDKGKQALLKNSVELALAYKEKSK